MQYRYTIEGARKLGAPSLSGRSFDAVVWDGENFAEFCDFIAFRMGPITQNGDKLFVATASGGFYVVPLGALVTIESLIPLDENLDPVGEATNMLCVRDADKWPLFVEVVA